MSVAELVREPDSKLLVTRHFTADSLNVVANHPSVYDWVRGQHSGYLDLTSITANPNNYVLMGEYGGVVFTQHQPGLYEAHTQVLPAGRGEWTVRMVEDALHYMFTRTDAVEIVTRVPKGNFAARALVKAIHGSLEFRMEKGWVIRDEVVFADVYALRIQDWTKHAKRLVAKGQLFHERLEVEYKRLGRDEPSHPEDLVHDRYVGLAAEMLGNGQAIKGVIFYNRWASIAGYVPIRIVTEHPLVIDIQDALIMVRDDSFWVMNIKA